MCLYPKLIINRKYTGTKKNGGKVPELKDNRIRFVPVACGQCMECRKAKANQWRVRLHEEIKVQKYKYFITLTIAPIELNKLINKYNIEDVNEVATKAVRLMLERIRKDYKKSIKHWIVTELGQNNSERIHLHGIIFTEYPINNEWLEKYWKYGHADTGKYCNARTVNYIVKYIFKLDPKHKGYIPKILCSSGLGKDYITNFAKEKHKYIGKETKDYYTLPNGQRVALPIYYRNKVFTEEEREKLWLHKIDKDTRFVNGIEIRKVLQSQEGSDYYYSVLKTAQENNIKLGYGSDKQEWRKKTYKVTLDMLKSKN